MGELHFSHNIRESDASSFDAICTKCGATDISGGGWGRLADPCPNYEATRIANECAEASPNRPSDSQEGAA